MSILLGDKRALYLKPVAATALARHAAGAAAASMAPA
jgi:hypothetical protein